MARHAMTAITVTVTNGEYSGGLPRWKACSGSSTMPLQDTASEILLLPAPKECIFVSAMAQATNY